MQQQIVNCPPDPLSNFNAIRSIGYDLNRALADVIDNSVSAGCKNITVIHHFDDLNSKIAIIDDGCGMSKDELINGMRLNSKNPDLDRNEHDLGRFGLGLKSASLSQAEILTVRSRKNREDNTAMWDLSESGNIKRDNEYGLILNPDRNDGTFILKLLDKYDTGTIVLWENLNDELFLSANSEKTEQNFKTMIKNAQKYLELTFHRFIGRGVNIYFSKVDQIDTPIKLKAWDPFLSSNEYTEQLPSEKVDGGRVTVTPFVLPFYTKISQREKEIMDGINGQLNHQGFYVYRNKRLIIPGTWFNYLSKHNQYNTARIIVDLPNNRDREWMLDIAKSEVTPPAADEPKMKSIMRMTQSKCKKVLAFKGKARQRKAQYSKDAFIWELVDMREAKKAFTINKNHPLIKEIIDNIVLEENKKRIKDLITLIEKNLPIITISNEFTTDEKALEIEHSDADYFFNNVDKDPLTKFRDMYKTFLNQGLNPEAAFNRTISIEPFIHNASIYESFKDSIIIQEEHE